MKLLALPSSPFSARILIQAREKGLRLEVAHPEKGQDIGQYAARNPFARIPVLLTGEDFIIESAAIAEYLEDTHPAPPLRPAEPLAVARMRAFVLAVDHYLFPALGALRALRVGSPELAQTADAVDEVVGRLQRLMDDSGYVYAGRLTLADCALVPACFYLERFLTRHGRESPLRGQSALRKWWKNVRRHDAVADVVGQLHRATRPQP